MNDNIMCCGTCGNSCGNIENLYCPKTNKKVNKYEGCMMYESKDKKESRTEQRELIEGGEPDEDSNADR